MAGHRSEWEKKNRICFANELNKCKWSPKVPDQARLFLTIRFYYSCLSGFVKICLFLGINDPIDHWCLNVDHWLEDNSFYWFPLMSSLHICDFFFMFTHLGILTKVPSERRVQDTILFLWWYPSQIFHKGPFVKEPCYHPMVLLGCQRTLQR